MTDIYIYTFLSVLAVSAVSLVGVFTLSFSDRVLKKYIFLLVSLATGALLGDAFIHLIPEAFEEIPADAVGLVVIAGILAFFIFENYLHWHHYHEEEDACVHDPAHPEGCPKPKHHAHPVVSVLIASDSVHNFLDGVIIGASFLVGVDVGIATTVAVMLHEIPQEFGDFGVLLHFGMTRARALFVNFVSALTAILGALVVLFLSGVSETITPWLVPFAAGGFIYIAASDLIPQLHNTKNAKQSIAQFGAILLGVGLMLGLLFFE